MLFAWHHNYCLDVGRSNENDVTYPLPVLGVRSTPFANAWGKVYSLSQSAELGLPGICHYYSNNKSICLQKSGGSDRVAWKIYLFPFALLCVLQSIWQLDSSVAPPLLQAETWSASISVKFHIRYAFTSCPIAQYGQLDKDTKTTPKKKNKKFLKNLGSVNKLSTSAWYTVITVKKRHKTNPIKKIQKSF